MRHLILAALLGTSSLGLTLSASAEPFNARSLEADNAQVLVSMPATATAPGFNESRQSAGSILPSSDRHTVKVALAPGFNESS